MRTKRPHHAVPSLAGMCILAGVLAGCTGANSGGDVFADLVEPFVKPTPSQVAREAFNVYDADKRRRSIALISASAFGHEQPYVRMYRLLIDDQDPTVRAACAHALGIHGTTEDALILIPLLNDDTGFVRWEAAKALQKIHHQDAVGPLIRTMADDRDPDVRMAAASALGQYPTLAVFNALVGALSSHDFGVVQSAANSLALLTGEDLGTDGGPWLDFAYAHTGNRLFAGQKPYTYMPYQKPPGKLQKIKFWEDPKTVHPQSPVGLERTEASTPHDPDV
jgi:HEAT repeats